MKKNRIVFLAAAALAAAGCNAQDVSAIGPTSNWAGAGVALLSLLVAWRSFRFSARMVARQLERVGDGLRSNVYTAVWRNWLEADRVFIQFPELRPYFYNGRDMAPGTSEVDKSRLEAIAELLLDCFAAIYLQKDYLPAAEWAGLLRYMKSVYITQPFFKNFVDTNGAWYSRTFLDELKAP